MKKVSRVIFFKGKDNMISHNNKLVVSDFCATSESDANDVCDVKSNIAILKLPIRMEESVMHFHYT